MPLDVTDWKYLASLTAEFFVIEWLHSNHDCVIFLMECNNLMALKVFQLEQLSLKLMCSV